MTTSVLQDKAKQLRELVSSQEELLAEFQILADEGNRLGLLLDENKHKRICSEAAISCVLKQIAEVKTVMRELIDASE